MYVTFFSFTEYCTYIYINWVSHLGVIDGRIQTDRILLIYSMTSELTVVAGLERVAGGVRQVV